MCRKYLSVCFATAHLSGTEIFAPYIYLLIPDVGYRRAYTELGFYLWSFAVLLAIPGIGNRAVY